MRLRGAVELDQIIGVIREVVDDPNLPVEMDDSFECLGLSSFDLMAIISIIEGDSRVRIDINEMASNPTVRGLLSSMHAD